MRAGRHGHRHGSSSRSYSYVVRRSRAKEVGVVAYLQLRPASIGSYSFNAMQLIRFHRWQSFLLGRPLSIAEHHFDTEVPSHLDEASLSGGRYFVASTARMRLTKLLGGMMDDAVSLKPIPYSSIMNHERALVNLISRRVDSELTGCAARLDGELSSRIEDDRGQAHRRPRL
jgi:hypothetical protein